jgi:hypothetical protein
LEVLFTMSRNVGLAVVLMLLAAGSASGAPILYTLDFAGSSTGSFVVDPDLAAPLGPSGVALDTYTIVLETSVGTLEFGPDDLTGGFVEARFIDGVLAGLHSPNGTTAEVTTASGDYGIAIFLSSLAGTAAEINPAAAGEGNFTIVSLPDVMPVDDVCCSYGFAQAGPPIPEPSSVLLFAAGAVIVAGAIARLRPRTN